MTVVVDFECPVHGQTVIVDEDGPRCESWCCGEQVVARGSRPLVWHWDDNRDLVWVRGLIGQVATDLCGGTGEIAEAEYDDFRRVVDTISCVLHGRRALDPADLVLGRPQSQPLDALQAAVGSWVDGAWPDETVMHSGLGLAEEAGELCRALLKRDLAQRGTAEEWTVEVRKEAADCLIVLLDIARREGFSLGDAVRERFVTVRNRSIDHDPLGGGDA